MTDVPDNLEALETLKNPVRAARERRGWTQKRAAEKVGVSTLTLSRWETGARRSIERSLAGQVYDALGVTPGALADFYFWQDRGTGGRTRSRERDPSPLAG